MKKRVLTICLILLGCFGLYIVNRYFSYVIQKNILDMRVDNKPHIPGVFLSDDKKNITRDGKVLVSIDDDIIFNFFKTKSQLCDSSNIDSNVGRKMFCENKDAFRSQTRFKSIAVSNDEMKVGFTLESDTLSPDTVVGIFYPNNITNKVAMLSNYYLGNEFIGFSPNSVNFVYKGGCFEAKCAFYIKDSDTLQDRVDFIPKEADARGHYEFVRWVSDTEIEYKTGGEIKKASLVTQVKEEGRIAAGYVSGKVSIGPFCPVERIDQPCTVPAQAYTSRSVIVYETDQVTVKEKVSLDTEGKYTIPLGPGTYFLQIQPAGIGPGEKKKVVIVSFKTTIVDFDIDTGIR